MKTTKILYWIFTGLFAALMAFSGASGIVPNEKGIEMMHGILGYPLYLIPFISVAKILGAIVILIPGWPRLKEWAYAGLVIDLLGATYSIIAVSPAAGPWSFMLLPLALATASYYFYHKKLRGA